MMAQLADRPHFQDHPETQKKIDKAVASLCSRLPESEQYLQDILQQSLQINPEKRWSANQLQSLIPLNYNREDAMPIVVD